MASKAAVLYCRVSSVSQVEEGCSLEAQESRLRAYCQMQGLEVVAVLHEKGVSGSVELQKREMGARALKLLQTGRAANLVALKLDRIWRSAIDALTHVERFNRKKVRVHLCDCGGTSIDTGSAVGKMFITMLAGMAEFERGLISERTSAALNYKKSRNEVYGEIPLGFDRDGDRLIENEAENLLIERIQRLRTDGLSYGRIATKLNDEGLRGKKGGKFFACTIRTLLKRVEAA